MKFGDNAIEGISDDKKSADIKQHIKDVEGFANIQNLDERAKNYNILTETINKNDITNLMSNSFGFDGTNATLVFSKI